MKFLKYVTGCLIGASFFIACNSGNAGETETESQEDWQPDMYQPSELVLVMRKMYDDNLALKEQIKAGEVPKEVPAKYHEMLTATATNPDELSDLYYAMAKTYLSNYEVLTQADSATAVTKYNAVVKTCIGCHENYCLGPIPKIEKLYIKE